MEAGWQDRMVAAAREYLGVPWRHAGRNRLGVDCVGLLVLAAQAAGIAVEDRTAYSRIVDPAALSRAIGAVCRKLEPGTPYAPADVLVIRYGASAQHVVLVSATSPELRIIHAFQTVGRVAEHRLDASWERRVAGHWRVKESG